MPPRLQGLCDSAQRTGKTRRQHRDAQRVANLAVGGFRRIYASLEKNDESADNLICGLFEQRVVRTEPDLLPNLTVSNRVVNSR